MEHKVNPLSMAMDYRSAEELVTRMQVKETPVPRLNLDLYILAAARMFGVSYSCVTRSQRDEAKRRTFPRLYSPDPGQRQDLIPTADELTRIFTPDELAEHCKEAGIPDVQAMAHLLRVLYSV